MNNLRRVIRKMILEAFSQKDVRAEMLATQRSYGATAKELFRRQAEEAPEIREFLNTLFYMHWSDVPVGPDGSVGVPMANKLRVMLLAPTAPSATASYQEWVGRPRLLAGLPTHQPVRGNT